MDSPAPKNTHTTPSTNQAMVADKTISKGHPLLHNHILSHLLATTDSTPAADRIPFIRLLTQEIDMLIMPFLSKIAPDLPLTYFHNPIVSNDEEF